ncbi:MAG: serine/threonine-protein kinase [Myxococcota bacterium]
MDAERFARLDDLLATLLDHPAETAEAQARTLCADDPALLDDLLALLAANASAGPLDDVVPLPEARPDPWLGSRVGPYRIDAVVGEGGMGRVYRAQRVDGAFEGTVAIKRIRTDGLTPRLRERFAGERRALAAIEHPGIARLLDAGTYDDVPYVVMEFVEGSALLEHAAEVSHAERLTLLAALCDAVDHAHGRLVVHRDLKPSNVRVRADGAPVLLDFGIAKLLHDDHEATRTTERAFTPRWAAPEQRDGGFVGPAADVYALGLLVERLLLGPRPTEAPQAPLQGRGDLRFVLQRALAPDPSQRYGSAGALAADLRALAGGRPVAAREGRLYRLGSFVRLHAVAVTLAALSLGLLVAYAVTLRTGQRALEEERDRARTEARRAQRTADFLEDTLVMGLGGVGVGDEVTVEALLARATDTLDPDAPANLDLLLLTARAQSALGNHDEAATLAEHAWALADRTLPAGDDRALRALFVQSLAEERSTRHEDARRTATRLLAQAVRHHGAWSAWTGRALIAQADALDRTAPGDATPRYAFGLALVATHGSLYTDEAAVALIGLGFAQWENEALGAWLVERGIEILVALHGEQHLRVADALQKLAHLRVEHDLRVQTLERAIAIERAVAGERHPWVANSLNDLALLVEDHDIERSLDLLQTAKSIIDEHNPPGSPLRALVASNLGAVHLTRGDPGAARGVLETTYAELEAGARSRTAVGYHLGQARAALGDHDGAREAFEDALQAARTHDQPRDRIDRLEAALAALDVPPGTTGTVVP